MRVKRIHLYRISIPFKKIFKHSSHERSAADNIVIETELEDGILGYGEGLPRAYVTGETPESVITALQEINSALFQTPIHQFNELLEFLDFEILSKKNFNHDRQNNTARCALELSLLDAYCNSFKKTFFDVAKTVLTNSEELKKASSVSYDGILSLSSFSQSLWSALKLKLFGFHRLKIKVGPEIMTILKTVKNIRKILGNSVDLRIDVNEAWTEENALSFAQQLKPFLISAIEQPLPHSKLMKMKELKKLSPTPLMLDESLCTLEDAKKAIDHELCHLFNIRLSKCGGFINSLKIAQLAKQNGIEYQLGCMVGETGILSAAGRQFATLNPDLRYLEGSYDRYLLRDNIIQEEISFGRYGKAYALDGWGLGVHIDKEKLKRYTTFSTELFG